MKYSFTQWKLVRFLFGAYLLFYFILLIPHAAELYSSQGVAPDSSLNFTYGWFPNILFVFDDPLFVTVFMSILALCSLVFALGYVQQPLALAIWYGWACFFARNNLTEQPTTALLGWLLLAAVLIPRGGSLFCTSAPRWKMPRSVLVGAWVVLGCAYSVSAVFKLMDPFWIDGSALITFLSMSMFARESLLLTGLFMLPPFVFQILTWLSLLIQLSSGPCYLLTSLRKYSWASMVIVHLFVLVFFDLTQISLGMLVLHIFYFDESWISPSVKKNIISLFGRLKRQ